MPVEITVVDRPAQPVVFMRRRVRPDEMQQTMAECLPAVFMHCQRSGLTFAGPPYTRYVDMSRGHFTIETGMPVVEAVGGGEVLAGELPGGAIARAVHAGPYDTLGAVYSELEAWAVEAGRPPSGAPWESYLTDPTEVPDPADWRTEVCLPL